MTSSTKDFYIGLALAISSSLFIGSSFIVKKKGLLKLNVRAGSGGYGYLKEWLWWAGLLLMAVGEAANFVAYAFAPATLVTPLGALSVLVSAYLASKLLKEHLNILGKTGCLVCLLGSTFVVLHSPKEQQVETLRDLEPHFIDPGFIVYCLMVLLVVVVFIFLLAPRHGTSNPLIYVTITGVIGSLSVMGCKALGVGLKELFAGKTEILRFWLFWFIIICVIFFISVQMVYLNKSLDLFNTAVVTPLLYVVFTTCVIIASGILYKEWSKLPAQDVIGNVCGFVTIICGVFLLQAFKSLNISPFSLLSDPRLQRAKEGNPSNDYTHKSYPGNNYHSYQQQQRLHTSYDAYTMVASGDSDEAFEDHHKRDFSSVGNLHRNASYHHTDSLTYHFSPSKPLSSPTKHSNTWCKTTNKPSKHKKQVSS